ncbi:hypothetical protein PENTCL1PPCAC_21361, partial [Pristionchus entomophagus]
SLEIQFPIGLHSTVCFRMEDRNSNDTNQSLLHTVTLARIEQHHPVIPKYQFAIPEVHTSCFCECDATERCSSAEYASERCSEKNTQNHGCYRTYFDKQPSTSCPIEAAMGSHLCCELKFAPFENITYTAIQLGSPMTYAVFMYTSYDYAVDSWVVKETRTIITQIEGISSHSNLDSNGLLMMEVIPSGQFPHQLVNGMYFTESTHVGSTGEIRMGRVNDFNDMNPDDLGWYRRNDATGRFQVPSGELTMKRIHEAKVIDCKQQRISSLINANYYKQNSFILPQYVTNIYRWIESAAFNESSRQVIVSHAHGVNLQLNIHVDEDFEGSLVLLHNSSRLDSFSGSIQVDSQSRHYLNIILTGATGKMNGFVRSNQSAAVAQIYHFTVYIHEISSTNRSLLVPYPATLDKGEREVCMRAEGKKEKDSICAVFPFHEEALE